MNISIIGGDSRIVELVKILNKNENDVFLYSLEKCDELSNYRHIKSLKEAIDSSRIIITSIPLSKDGKFVNSTFSSEKVTVKGLFSELKNKKVITGNIPEELKQDIETKDNNEIIDVMECEELTILNAIPTAEGAIQVAMEKSAKTIHNSKCLILGFGRIGKVLSKMLSGLGADVYCEARKKQDISWIKAYGYKAIHLDELNENLGKFDFIFNTIPYVILEKERLNLIRKDCLLIDLASKPGGIDFEQAKKMKLQFDWALALPGKVAPKTAANYIYEIIKNELK